MSETSYRTEEEYLDASQQEGGQPDYYDPNPTEELAGDGYVDDKQSATYKTSNEYPDTYASYPEEPPTNYSADPANATDGYQYPSAESEYSQPNGHSDPNYKVPY